MELKTMLIELTSEFKAFRESGMRRFPEHSWQKALVIAKKTSLDEVCKAIHVPVPYLKKKALELGAPVPAARFIEAIPQFHTTDVTSFEHLCASGAYNEN
jgi:hypothetical protein